MTAKTPMDEMDEMTHEFARSLVDDVMTVRKQISRPAMSVKLSRADLWAKYGQDYQTLREDPASWEMTLKEMGEEETLKFGREMELAMMEAMGVENGPQP